MSDMRLVTVTDWSGGYARIFDSATPTHVLVSVDEVKIVHDEFGCVTHRLFLFVCPDCGGSGEINICYNGQPSDDADADDCPTCNGRGWVVKGGDGE